jgi:hypothetical protein
MARARDGQEFGDAFDEAKDDRFEPGHARSSLLPDGRAV